MGCCVSWHTWLMLGLGLVSRLPPLVGYRNILYRDRKKSLWALCYMPNFAIEKETKIKIHNINIERKKR